jgi:hypothetical protein
MKQQKNPGIKKFILKGDHYSIGVQLGQRVKGLALKEYSSEVFAFSQKCRDLAKEIYPPIIDKAEGMIEGGKFDRKRFEAMYFARGFQIKACAGFALGSKITRDGNPLVGRNYHWPCGAQSRCEVREIHTEGVYSAIGYTHNFIGFPDVLNSEGLFVCLFSMPALKQPSPGLQWHMIMDMVAETCRSVKEALSLVTSLPHVRSYGYLMGDKNGKVIATESFSDGVFVKQPKQDFLVMTNFWAIEKEMKPGFDDGVYGPMVKIITERLPNVDKKTVKQMLVDHQTRICSGPHETFYKENDKRWGTLYSIICRPRQLELSISPGPPCMTPYYSVGFQKKH